MSELTPEERIAAAQARRDKTKAAHDAAYSAQLADDLEALADLEETHGYERVHAIKFDGWEAGRGAATMVVVRLPDAKERVYKRFQDTVSEAKDDTSKTFKAADALADVCIVYPAKDSDLLKATLELAAGVKSTIAVEIMKKVQGRAEKEKKG